MEYLKYIGVFIGGSGFWMLLKFLIDKFLNKRLAKAQLEKEKASTTHLLTDAGDKLVQNWIEWSQKLENRINELEHVAAENSKLKSLIESQKKKIITMEKKVNELCKVNASLNNQLSEFLNRK